MREDDQYNRKLIQDLRDERNKMNDQMRTSEVEARRDIERLKDRIKLLENELMESERKHNGPLNDKDRSISHEEKNHGRMALPEDKESSIHHHQQQVHYKNNNNNNNNNNNSNNDDNDNEYSYDDDFEPESIAEEEEDDALRVDDSHKSISEEKSDKIQDDNSAATNKEKASSVHTGKYDDDTFEEESVSTLKSSSLSLKEECGGSVVDGEACEESVPEIESDGDDNGLFFGSSRNVSLDIPEFTSPHFNNSNNCKSKNAVKIERQESVLVVGSEHAHKKELKPQAETNLHDSASPRLTPKIAQETKNVASLSGESLLKNDDKPEGNFYKFIFLLKFMN